MRKILVVGAIDMGTTTLVDNDMRFVEKPSIPITPMPLHILAPQYTEPIKQSKHHNSKTKKRKPKTKKTHRK